MILINGWLHLMVGHMDPKIDRGSWDEKAKKIHSLNVKAMNVLVYSLSETKYIRVSWCTSAQYIWVLLQVTHEGTSLVKYSKISLLTSQYEAFKIKDGESINSIYN